MFHGRFGLYLHKIVTKFIFKVSIFIFICNDIFLFPLNEDRGFYESQCNQSAVPNCGKPESYLIFKFQVALVMDTTISGVVIHQGAINIQGNTVNQSVCMSRDVIYKPVWV